MVKIEVDAQVYAHLEANARGFETPNEVLKRLLPVGLPATPLASTPLSLERTRRGKLMPLIEAGWLAEGHELECKRERKGDLLKGTVTGDGCIQTELGIYESPSPALRDLVGHQIDGWANWYHPKSGSRLRDLRARVRSAS